MEVDTSIYRSPKRKRGQVTHGPSLITSGLSRGISPYGEHMDDIEIHSPSTKVTGKLQKLDLQSPLDLPPAIDTYMPYRQPSPNDPPPDMGMAISTPPQDFKPPEAAEFSFQSMMPKPTESVETQPQPTLAPNRSRSPPPSSVVSEQFWQASEITGWTPDDPDEDNYGVNGVGYAKPASQARAISQKRKQQIADYRSRETKEARQRRHEKRLSGFNSRKGSPMESPGPAMSSAGRNSGSPGEGKGVRFVHFEDG